MFKEDIKNFHTDENKERVHVQTGMTKRNVELTYINNGHGVDKSKMLRVLSLGSMCTEQDVTSKELEVALKNVIAMREVNGNS